MEPTVPTYKAPSTPVGETLSFFDGSADDGGFGGGPGSFSSFGGSSSSGAPNRSMAPPSNTATAPLTFSGFDAAPGEGSDPFGGSAGGFGSTPSTFGANTNGFNTSNNQGGFHAANNGGFGSSAPSAYGSAAPAPGSYAAPSAYGGETNTAAAYNNQYGAQSGYSQEQYNQYYANQGQYGYDPNQAAAYGGGYGYAADGSYSNNYGASDYSNYNTAAGGYNNNWDNSAAGGSSGFGEVSEADASGFGSSRVTGAYAPPALSRASTSSSGTKTAVWNPATNAYGGGGGGPAAPIAPVYMTSSSTSSLGPNDNTTKPKYALVSFGFGGKLVIMFPKAAQRLGGGPATPATRYGDNLRKGPIYISSLHTHIQDDPLITEANDVKAPLSNLSASEIMNFCDKKISKYSADPSPFGQDSKVLWTILRNLYKNHGVIREANRLSPFLSETVDYLLAESEAANANLPPPMVKTNKHEGELQAVLRQVETLVQRGNLEEAARLAADSELWGHAMLIGGYVKGECYKSVVQKFTSHTYAVGSPMLVLFNMYAGVPAVDQAFLSQWKSNVASILSNRTDNEVVALHKMGDRLLGEGNAVSGAHSCYLLGGVPPQPPSMQSKIVLIGTDHRALHNARLFILPEYIQATEVYEAAMRSGNSQYTLPCFQSYKLLYAMFLADMGLTEKAGDYVQNIVATLRASGINLESKQPVPTGNPYSIQFVRSLKVLIDRLRPSKGGIGGETPLTSPEKASSSSKRGSWFGGIFSAVDKTVTSLVENPEPTRNVPDAKSNYGAYPGAMNPAPAPAPVPAYVAPQMTSPAPHPPAMRSQSSSGPTAGEASPPPASDKAQASTSSPPNPDKPKAAASSSSGGWFKNTLLGFIPTGDAKRVDLDSHETGEANKPYFDKATGKWVIPGREQKPAAPAAPPKMPVGGPGPAVGAPGPAGGGPPAPGASPAPAAPASGVDALMAPAAFGRTRTTVTRANNRYVDPFSSSGAAAPAPTTAAGPPAARPKPPAFAVFNPGSAPANTGGVYNNNEGGGGGGFDAPPPPSY